jgi:hypothetical protein
MSNKIVARYRDGRTVKGASMDIDPGRPTCHVRTPEGKTVQILLKDLKALFFVRSLEGDAKYDEARTLDPQDLRSRGSKLLTLTFEDGETMVGLTNRYPPNRTFFFILPVDPESNNIRMLVNRDAVTAMEAVDSPGSAP